MIMKLTKQLLFLMLFLLIGLISCQPDEEIDPNEDPRDKFVGSWTCKESSIIWGNTTFTVEISLDSSNTNRVLMKNFYHLGTDEEPYGIVSNYNIILPLQYVCDNTIQINGTGDMINKNRIDWIYYSDDGADLDTVTAVFTK